MGGKIMIKLNCGRAKLLLVIYRRYGDKWFKTVELNKMYRFFGLSETSMGAAISFLGKEGYLEKTRGSYTTKGRKQKQWRLTNKGLEEAERLMRQANN